MISSPPWLDIIDCVGQSMRVLSGLLRAQVRLPVHKERFPSPRPDSTVPLLRYTIRCFMSWRTHSNPRSTEKDQWDRPTSERRPPLCAKIKKFGAMLTPRNWKPCVQKTQVECSVFATGVQGWKISDGTAVVFNLHEALRRNRHLPSLIAGNFFFFCLFFLNFHRQHAVISRVRRSSLSVYKIFPSICGVRLDGCLSKQLVVCLLPSS